ncbi:phytoene desaturase family protein [Pararhodonellum marinum]|uniref:phytoene desaturase family protein n=1 Tax=Pararhodonellum marinum TaxID=2755358 RepID=UPI00188EB06B|nr:NAD(P)/FAD-dependent oxidoreductase [Pararhodonellum marinum]
MANKKYDAVVVGSGPNGLAAAIRLQQQGLGVLLMEGKPTIGGGMRTLELTLPGFAHDICSAIHPLAVSSPFFKKLPLEKLGLEWIHPPILASHPLEEGEAALLLTSLQDTANRLGKDKEAYLNTFGPMVEDWEKLLGDFLAPLKIPNHPILLAKFGLKALRSAEGLGKSVFQTEKAKGLWAGMAAHGMMPLNKMTTAAIALVLMSSGHHKGWPIPKGGSQSLANALLDHFKNLGGEVQTGQFISKMDQLPTHKAVVFDLTPRQLMDIAGDQFSRLYKWQLNRYRYGMGVFKMDWALKAPIPFLNMETRKAGTVHLGGKLQDIADAEAQTWQGKHPEKPYVLLAQQSLFDPTRAPKGQHTAWAYCHVPNGSTRDMTEAIENQVERYAPGFKDLILAKSTFNAQEMQAYNPNYIGGDINGGVLDLGQLYTRPALRMSPYRTSAKGIYLCSSSTPPGGGVHGMCGFYAAERVIKDFFI